MRIRAGDFETGESRDIQQAAGQVGPQGRSLNVGPVSISASGVQISGGTTAASRDYYNRVLALEPGHPEVLKRVRRVGVDRRRRHMALLGIGLQHLAKPTTGHTRVGTIATC